MITEYKCKQCGHCCILKSTVCLTPKEVAYGNYLYRKNPLDDDIILKKEWKYIPELGNKRLVCIYYDPENTKCTIHKRQPKACKEIICNEDQFEDQNNFFSWPPKKGRVSFADGVPIDKKLLEYYEGKE